MGAVYEATHEITRQAVALKYCGEFRVEKLRRRVMAEARAHGLIRHPNVVRIFDVFDEDGRLYLVLELLHGETLLDLIARGPIPPADAARIMIPILRAVHTIHGQNIIHRDLKPANIFLARDEAGGVTPKILDFGIAQVTNATRITAQ